MPNFITTLPVGVELLCGWTDDAYIYIYIYIYNMHIYNVFSRIMNCNPVICGANAGTVKNCKFN